MIAGLINAFFNLLLNLVGTIIQLICLPINALISAALPDLSSWITDVGTGFTQLFNSLPWALSILPTSLLVILAFCYSIKLAVSTFSMSTHMLIKVWNVFQKIKFW